MPGRHGRKNAYEFVKDLVEIGGKIMSDQLDVPLDQAKQTMLDVAQEYCFRNARGRVYIPAALEFELTARDKLIWAAYQQDGPSARKFSGARVDELAVEHTLTPQQIYSILRLMKRREIEARQRLIPGVESVEEARARA